ncbi:MAG: hypothetical protein P8L85_24985 [Rubripirellula sp.]|nr:hypothetical protein [Rubripirellula sp.]
MTDSPENQNTIENLIAGHFDGDLTREQEEKLAQELTHSTLAKQLFRSYMRMEGRLHSLGRDGYFRGPDAATQHDAATQEDARQRVEITPAAQASNQHFSFNPFQFWASSRLWAATSSLAACAALLLLIGWVLRPADVSASNVLHRAQQAAADLVDRAYRVTISRGDRQRGDRGQQLMLNLRGGRNFVIQPMDGSYTMGSDGTDLWIFQRDGPVWITSDYRKLAPEILRRIPNRNLLRLADSPNEPFMLKMSSLLSLIETSYDIELIKSTDPAENHVRAILRSGRANRPENIEFWADANNGVVLRAESKWKNGKRNSVELIDTPTVSNQWYHYSQHAANRPVNRLRAKN